MGNFATAYAGHNRIKLHFIDEDSGDYLEGAEPMTEQHHKDEVDINRVLAKADKTGLLTHVQKAKAMYGDFTEVNEYQTSLNLVNKAQGAFMDLPSKIRKRFNHDPGEFLEFVTNPANLEEMAELGLATKRQVKEHEAAQKETVEPAQGAG